MGIVAGDERNDIMQDPLISLIVPVYRAERYFETCVRSMMEQEYRNLEIILIDDGSPDGCPQMCDAFAREDARVRVIHQENAGVSAARNAGLDVAAGEWIGFVDSDDVIHASMVKCLYEMAERNGSEITSCRAVSFSSGNPVTRPTQWQGEASLHGERAAKDALLGKMPLSLWLSLYHSSLFQQHAIRFPPISYGEDLFVVVWLLRYAGKVTFTQTPLYGYRQHEESAMAKGFSGKSDGVDMSAQFENMVHAYFSAAKERAPELMPYIELLCSSLGHGWLVEIIRIGNKQMLDSMGKDLRQYTLKHWKACPATIRQETFFHRRVAMWLLRCVPWLYLPLCKLATRMLLKRASE